MSVYTWWQSRFSARTRKASKQRSAPQKSVWKWYKPQLEKLEDRLAPAIASLSDGVLTIDYTATGSDAESVEVSSDGIDITLAGEVTGTTSYAVGTVSKIVVLDTGESTNQVLTFSGTETFTLSQGLESTGVETVTINQAINVTGESALSITAPKNIQVNAGLSTESGDLTLAANQDVTAFSGSFVGIDVNAATIASNKGKITLEGRGGDTDNWQHGVSIQNGAVVGFGTTGAVTIEGTGGASNGVNNQGVYVNGTSSQITSGGGNVSVTGTGSGSSDYNFGVSVSGGGEITAGGDGTVTVVGAGGNTAGDSEWGRNHGVDVSGGDSRITSSGGDVSVTGTGGGPDGSSDNFGVSVSSGGEITAGGSGAVTVVGTGGKADHWGNSHGVIVDGTGRITSSGGDVSVTGTGGSGSGNGNFGIWVAYEGEITAGDSGAVSVAGTGGNAASKSESGYNYGVFVLADGRITSGGGDVSVTGTGGGSGETDLSSSNHGVAVGYEGEITAVGSGTVTVVGTGGNAAGAFNAGVYVSGGNSLITSSGGDVSVTGTGGGSGDSGDNYGVHVQSGGEITAGGDGTVTVVGTGGNATNSSELSNNNFGVFVESTDGRITSSGGDLSVTGTGGSGSSSVGIRVDYTGQIVGSTGTPTVTLTADSIELFSDTSIDAGSNTVIIRPKTDGTLIDLGGTDVLTDNPLTLGLTSDELNRITAATLQVGDSKSGNITVSTPLPPLNVVFANLVTGGAVSVAAGGALALAASQTVDTFNSADDTTVNLGTTTTLTASSGTFSGDMTGDGNFTKTGAGTFTFTVDSNSSYTGTTTVSGGTLVVNSNLTSSSGVLLTGGILGGSGTVPSVTATGGSINPGNSPGILNVDGDYTLNDETTQIIELTGTGNTAGTHYDQVVATGAVSLGDAILDLQISNFAPPSGSRTFTIITGASVTGEFAGLSDLEIFTDGVYRFQIDYTANSVELTLLDPLTVFVNADWGSFSAGQDPDGAGAATAIGYDAFATLTAGITAVAATGTVNVDGDDYSGEGLITVAKDLSLVGSGTVTVHSLTDTTGFSIQGNYTASAGDFTFGGGTLTLTNTTSLTANGKDVAFNGAVSGTGHSLTVDTGTAGGSSIAINDSLTAGTLSLTSASITDGASGSLVVSGTTTLAGGTVLLDSSSNDFGSVTIATAQNVLLQDANSFTLNASTVNNGFELGGGTANLNGTLDVGGTLTVSGGTLSAGAHTIEVGGDVVFTGGNFSAGSSTLLFDGNTEQQLTANGQTVHHVTVDGGGNTLQLTESLSLTGNFNNQDSFDANGQSVTFSGSGTQTVTGAGGSNGFAAVTVAPGSTVQLGSAMLVASLTLQVDGSNAAQVALDSQTLTLNGLLTLDVVNSGAGVAQISGAGALSLGGSQRTFDIEDNAGSVALNIVSVIDNGSILKTGAGTLEFSGSSANTYTGTTTVNAGTLRLNKTSATAIAGNLTVGDGTGTDTVVVAADNQIHEFAAITLKSGGTLTVLTDVVSTVGSLTFEGGGSIDLQGNTTWLSLNGNVAFTGITGSGSISGAGIFNLLGASRTFTVADSDAAQDLVISTTITNGGVVKDGAGTLRLSGPDNSYVGTTTVTAGVLELAGGTAIHDSAQVDVNGGTLSVLASETVTTLNAVDGAIVSLGSSTTLTVSSGSFAGDMTGSGGFTKTGGGTFTFTSVSSNDYAGTTTVSGGTLLVNGSLAAGGAVQVASGATLGGSGSVGDVTVASGGFLAPGTSIETLEVVDLDQSGTLTIELTGDSDEPVAGTDYDQVIASGTITLSGTLVIAPSSFTAPLGTTYTIIKNNGASSVIGAFSNAAEDEEFESGGRTWKVNYNVGDDEDVVLTLLNTAPTVANEIPNQPFGAAAGNWTFQFEPDTFADVDGQTLTYTAQLTGSIPLPSWLDFDGETRTFTGNPPFDAPTSLSIEVTANDGAGGTVTDTFTLTLAPPLNDSPDLNSAEDVTLNGVQEDAPGPLGAVGTLVSALVDLTSPSGGLDNVTDPDGPALGVAIVGANTANGTWHYSLDDGDNWIAFATHGTLSESKALLLDASARIYFVPGLNFNGTISNAITFRAWDQSQGTASGTTFDVDSIGTGNGCAFSGAFDTAEIIVSAVNDAPAVTDGATHNLASTNENTTSSATPVSTILTGVGYEEFDAGDSSGIAVTAATGNGAWEFLVSGGSTWTAFGAVSGTTALLLASDTQVRYVPDGENGETATFSFRAWDRTTDSASTDETPSYATPGAGGGATAYSLNSANASITVTPDNDAPELSDTTVTLNAVAEDAAPPVGAVGTLVSSLVSLGGNVSDVDTGAVTGVAVIAANTTNGSWFYTTNGSDWNGLGAVTGSTARLLAADGSTRIYFQPSDHFNGTVSEAITFRAWDRTQGANGDIFDAAANVGSPHAFSTATDTASITVTAVNDAPVVAGSSAVTLAAIGEDTTEPAGATVDDLFAARFSDAADQVSGGSIANEFYGIAIIGSAVDAAQGQWQYFDGSWLDVGERGLTNALVVTAGNSLRFVPAENFNGTPNSLTVVLIDDSAVTGPENGSEVDLTGATGGTTAYSDATDEALTLSTSVTAVNDVPSFALPGDPDQTVAEDSGAHTVPGFATLIDDGDPEATQTLTFNVSTSNDDLFAVLPEIDETTGNLTYTLAANANGSATVTVTLSDDGGDDDTSAEQTFTITVTAVNDAPVTVGAGTVNLTPVPEDSATPTGATVGSLFAARFSDAADQVSGGSAANLFHGIAIIGSTVNAAQGQWQYFNGSDWVAVGSRTLSTALAVTFADSLRFLPAENFNGTPNSLTVVLIDDSAVADPATGDVVDLTGATGGTTAYSDDATQGLTLSTSVTAVNDAPVVNGSNAVSLAAVAEDTTDPAGATVNDLFLSRYSDAADQVTGGSSANTFHGIAIIGSTVNTAEGQWQYHNGSGWVDVDNRGLSTALVVTAGNSLRFLPAADFSGTPNSLTVVLIDDSAVSDPTTGTEINLTGVTGSTTAYSDAATETLTLSTTITEINDAPIRVSPGGSTIEIDEDTTTNLNLDFGPGGGSDENGQALTIVFTALPDAALGQLQLADNTPVALSTNYTLEQVQGIKFAPAADTFGTATFSYTVTDNGTTNGVDDFKSLNETLTIQVNNDNVVGESFGVVLPPVAAGTFTLRVNGGILEVFDGTSVIASQTLATTPNVVIHGSANTDDTLILDLDSGFTGSITFHGGAGGNDAIQLENGGTFTTVQHVLDATFGAGSITLTGGNQDYSGFAINYTGLEPVMDNLLTTTRVIEFASGAEIITISDHGTAGDGFIEIVSSAPSEMIIMEAPTVSLTVIANDAGDTIEVTSFDSAFGAALILDGGGGIVDIQVALGGVTPLAGLTVSNAATVTVGAVTTSGAISLTSTSSTTLQGNLQTDGGTVSFLGAGNVILDAAAISIDTDVGDNNGSGAAVSFAGTTAVSATANGTTLSIDTRAAAGAGGAVTLDAFNSAGGAAVDGLTVQAGNAAVSFNDAASFTASSPITVTGASFTVAAAGSIATSGGTVTINANAMDIQGAINAGAGTVNLRPQTDGTTIGLGGGTGTLQLTDAELDQITAGVLVIGSHTDASDPVDAGAISVDLVDLTDGLGVSTLVLRTTGTITQKVVDAAADILVDNLSLQAGGNIIIQIDADNLAATTTTGQITITDTAGGLTIDDLSGSGGADGVSHTGSGNVTVSVTGANSNLTVGALVTGGNVTLNAAGDVALAGDVTAEGGGNVRITADSDNDTNGAITRTSGTVSAEDGGGVEADAADGINLVTAASSLSARNDSSGHISISNDSASLAVTLVDSIDGISNTGAGNISISNTGTLAVASKVSTAGGKIELTGTTITVNETIVSDSGTDGDITLTADEFVINTGINAGTAIVTLQNQTANTAIQLGNGKGATAGIDLADAELNQITAGTLRIGSTTAGQISISEANVGPNNVTGDFTLLSGAGVDDNSDTGTIVFNGGLLIDVDQSVDLSGSNNVNTLSVITSDANQFVTFVDSDGLAIGGITTKGGNVGITATTINLNAGINTSTGSGGAVSLTGPVILTNTVVITTDDGNVTFSGTVNGNFDLTVNTANATTTFTGAVGGDVALASLTTDAGGTTELNGGSVSTTGAQTYNDAVTLGADTDINTTTTGGVAFQDTLDGAFALTVVAVADATFGDEVGGGTPLASLDVTANQINLDGGLVETSGDQTYQSAVVLGAATTVASSAGGNITFGGAVDSEASEANTLTVNTTGTTTFSGAVGGGVNGALGSLTTNAGGTTAINGGAVDTTGAQTYGDAVTLGVQDATLTASTLSMTVLNLGSSGLTVDVSGASSITGKISGGSVNSLTKNGAGTLTLSNGSNNYTGLTTINNGVLKVTTNKALGADGAGNGTRVNSGAMLDLAVLNYSALEELFMNGGELHASNTSTFAGDITLEALDSFFSAVAGKTLTLNGAIVEEDDETNGLTVTRPGTVVLKGNGSYSGETEVTNGKLLINGAIDGSVLVSGGTLGGNGTIGGNVTADSGGTVAPGTSAGLLSVGGNGNFTSGATYSVELNGPGAGTGYDQLLVNGTANLNGAILALSATQVYSSGTVLTIIDGANSGTFAGLDDGDTITATGTSQVFTINYEAGSVTLTAGSLDLIDTVATVSGPSLVVVGQQAVFTVTVTGGPTPTGLVTLYVDGHIVASGPLNSGQASFATSSLSIGTHTVSAYYNGDSTHDPDTSNNFTVNVVTPSVVDNFTRADTIGTTIAGASIGQLLPSGSGVLNVADTTGFASSGQLIIHFGGGAFTTVNYTGKTGTSFTGVTGGQTLAGVPLDAGDTVRPLTSLGSGWSNVTPPVGNFVVNSNQAVSVGSTSNLALVNGLAPADVSLSAAIDVSADNRRGELVARRDAAGNEYVGGVQRINATTHRLYIGIRTGSAGTLATLNSVVVSTPPSVLRFEVVGTTLRLYGDGVLLLSAQDATLAAAGGIGINAINTNVRFDNFIAAAVVPISLPFNDNFAQPSSTSLGASWSVDAGGFSNPSAGAATAGSATLNVASLYGVLASDVSAQANFSSSSMGSGLGVVVRWDSVARSGYYLQATDAGDIELYSVTAGVVSLITSGSGTILENNQLMLTANGSTLDVFLNGALLFSATNSLYTTGSVGIASAGGSLFSGFSAITP